VIPCPHPTPNGIVEKYYVLTVDLAELLR